MASYASLLYYIANFLSVAPFADPKWRRIALTLNCVTLACIVFCSWNLLQFATARMMVKDDVLFGALLIVNYTFEVCTVGVAIIFAIFRARKFAKLAKTFVRCAAVTAEHERFVRKLFAFSAVVLLLLLTDLSVIYAIEPIEITITCMFLVTLVLIYHVLLLLYVSYVNAVQLIVAHVNRAIRGMKSQAIARDRTQMRRVIAVRDVADAAVKLINQIFELPLFCFHLVFATNILIFIYVAAFKLNKIYGVTFYMHDVVFVVLLAWKCGACNLELEAIGRNCCELGYEDGMESRASYLLYTLTMLATKRQRRLSIFNNFVVGKRMILLVVFGLVDYVILLTQFDALVAKK